MQGSEAVEAYNCTSIWEVQCSNFDQSANYYDYCFRDFPHSLRGNAGITISNKSLPPTFKLILIIHEHQQI
jgi:hypothetical protein